MVKFEDALAIVQEAILAKEGENSRGLNGIERAIIEGVCQRKTYQEIANSYHCTCQNVNNEAANLWRRISKAFGEKVTGNNFRSIIERKLAQRQAQKVAIAEKEMSPLAQQMKALFEALDYTFEEHEEWKDNYFEWAIKVPRGFIISSILVRGVEGEVGINDIRIFRQSISQQNKTEGWLITTKRISNAAHQEIGKYSSPEILCLTFDALLDKVINFDKYINWLETEVKRLKIDRIYVPLACKKDEFAPGNQQKIGVSYYNESDGWIDRYVNQWLDDPAKSHLSILGEFGTGKTWFALHYAWTCLQRYRDEKQEGFKRPRFPLVINLRDYNKDRNDPNKKVDVKEILETFLGNKHNIHTSLKVFELLNGMGKLLLIFDGFDEMADKIDRQKMINNFWELAKVIVPGSKVILTCRKEHFPDAKEGCALLSAELKASTAKLTGETPQFEVLELEKFNDEQIRQVLSYQTNSATVEVVMGNPQLLDLASRPVMTELILEALPDLEADIAAGKPVDISRVYLYAVRQKMDRDIRAERTFTCIADKLYFLCELSWEMIYTDQMSLNYKFFPDRIRQLFGIEEDDLDHWHYDMMGNTMLIRNDDGDYTPAHRSLLEFFVAYKFAAELGVSAEDFTELARGEVVGGVGKDYTWSSYFRRNGQSLALKRFISESLENLRETFGRSQLTKAVLDLLLPMVDAEKKEEIIQVITETRGRSEDEVGYLGGNAATLAVKIDKTALEGKDFSDTVIKKADFSGASLRDVNFAGTNLADCVFTQLLSSVSSVAFSPDGKLLATGDMNGVVILWDISSKRKILTCKGHSKPVNSVVFSTDGQILASGSGDQTIRLWNIPSGECFHTLYGHTSWVNSVAFSTDGQTLASGSDDQTIRLWNISSGKCFHTLYGQHGHTGWVNSVAFSVDGQTLASGSDDQTIRLWNISSGECFYTLHGYTSWVYSVAFSADGQTLASGSSDQTIRLWNISSGECFHTLYGHTGCIRSVAFSNDGQILASGSNDQTIRLWNIPSGECFYTLHGHTDLVRSVAFSVDGQTLASGSDDQTIRLWNIPSGECFHTLHGHTSWVRSISFSHDGQTLASGSDDQTIRLWNISSGECFHTLHGHTSWVYSVAFSADGQTLASCSDDSTTKIWNIETGECLKTLRNDRPYEKMNITGVKGLTEVEITSLKALGAVEDRE